MSMRILGGILIIGILNFPGICTGLARNAVVFSIPGIVLIFGGEDKFTPPVIDIKFIVFNEVGCGEYGFKVVVNAIVTWGEGIRHIESHDFTLLIYLKGSVNAPVGIYSNEHDVVIGDVLRRIGMSRIYLCRLGTVTKLPEVIIPDSVGVVDVLYLSGEEVDLRGGGIEGSHGPCYNTDGTVSGIGSDASVCRSNGKCHIKTSELIKGVVCGIGGEDNVSISECPKHVGVLPDGLIDELRLEWCASKVVRDVKEGNE